MIPEAWRGRGVVAVIGLGKSGVAATRLLAREGVRVYASDASDHPYGGDALRTLRTLSGVNHLLHPPGAANDDQVLAPSVVTALQSWARPYAS